MNELQLPVAPPLPAEVRERALAKVLDEVEPPRRRRRVPFLAVAAAVVTTLAVTTSVALVGVGRDDLQPLQRPTPGIDHAQVEPTPTDPFGNPIPPVSTPEYDAVMARCGRRRRPVRPSVGLPIGGELESAHAGARRHRGDRAGPVTGPGPPSSGTGSGSMPRRQPVAGSHAATMAGVVAAIRAVDDIRVVLVAVPIDSTQVEIAAPGGPSTVCTAKDGLALCTQRGTSPMEIRIVDPRTPAGTTVAVP